MNKRPSPHSPFDGIEKRPAKQGPFIGRELLDAIDETPEFHDPFSELNLFLSKKVREEMHHCCNSKKWSVHLQEQLLQKITPEFQKRFPKYRLGIAALKQTWEKISHYSTQIEGEKEVLTKEGKLNIPFLIKENLRSTERVKNTCHLHPYHYAHQLAVKMSECIAVMDGIRPRLDKLTQTIWSLQRHLIPKLSVDQSLCPYDENERADKLILKSLLEISAKRPQLTQEELSFRVDMRLKQIDTISLQHTRAQVEKIASALLAETLGTLTQRQENLLSQTPYGVAKTIKRELAIIMIDFPLIPKEQIAQDVAHFFDRTKGSLSELSDEELHRKIHNWTIQGDLAQRWLKLNEKSALFTIVLSSWKTREKKGVGELLAEIEQRTLTTYPALRSYAKEAMERAQLFLKYIWYTQGFSDEQPTFDRFIAWQKWTYQGQPLGVDELLEKVETTTKAKLPLIPFNRARVRTLLVTENP